MATSTTRVSLTKPDAGDTTVIRNDFNTNMDLIDAAVGAAVVTSSTRPSSAYSGKLIEETDTSAVVVRENSNWKYVSAPVASTITSITPTHTGQLGVQSSDLSLWKAGGTAASSWTPVASTFLSTYLTGSTQSVPNNTDTYVYFGNGTPTASSNAITTSGTASTGTTFTFARAGVWAITAQVVFASSTTGKREVHIVNGADANVRWGTNTVDCSGNPLGTPHCSAYIRVAVNDTIKLMCSQNSGGALDLENKAWGVRPRISFMWVGY